MQTNNMTTQLFGEYDDLIKIFKVEMEKTFEYETNCFNLKIVNGDSRKYNLEDEHKIKKDYRLHYEKIFDFKKV